MRPQLVLHRFGRHVLAAGGDDQFLLPADDAQKPVLNSADIAGIEPAIVCQHFAGGLLVVPVAAEHLGPLRLNFAILGETQAGARHRSAHRSRTPGVDAVHRQHRSGFGQAVALKDAHTDPIEEVGQTFTQRAAPAEGETHRAAEPVANLAIDEPIEQCVLGAGEPTDRPLGPLP